ncbi:hypothetical protein [Bacillus pseudomycoides]|uniref:hypothetical protein n=1 Tax=Bacillus pseudomycoides TaxID=64104 RepID=UPI00059EBC6B|nr:hypothetical protein [Bacillus pseudomycoides]PGC41406.1 50S ribosomal protein L7ae [Bacillus pseudomycoides]
MSIGSEYNSITSNEIAVIHAYVTGEEISSSKALKILKRFAPKEVQGSTKPSRMYYKSKNVEEVFEYYKSKNPKLFAKQELNNYEELKYRATNY